MIFVTVGTHEQSFERLVKYIDELKGSGKIEEEVIVQTGFTDYEPVNCTFSKLFSYQDMVKYVAEARLVITHGGPSSFIMPLQVGKIPVVVPRQKKFDEHVNDHQLDFAKQIEERQGNIIVVEDIEKLEEIILNYDSIISAMPSELVSNNEKFNVRFSQIVDELLNK